MLFKKGGNGMNRLLTNCPGCCAELRVAVLKCPECGMELRNEFALSPFDRLDRDQYDYLLTFLRQRGSLKGVQKELGLSYPTAKRRLNGLLLSLGLLEDAAEGKERADVSAWTADPGSGKASEIIKAKLKEAGGRVVVRTVNDLPCEIRASEDGKTFTSDKLPVRPTYGYEVFDVIVELLLSQGGRAKKGNGRSRKLGEPQCDETTVVGAVAKNYAGKANGDSVFDPVFALAAVLDWAGIAHNQRGELTLTAEYRGRL